MSRRSAVSALGAALALIVAPGAGASPVPPTQEADTLTLGQAIRLALDADPGVAGAEAAADGAAAAVRVVEAARLPSLSSTAGIVRFDEPMVVAPIHALDATDRPRFDRTLIQGRLELGYSVWDGGARGARVGRARASEAAGEAAVRSARQDLAAEVVTAYLGVLTARDVMAAQEARLLELREERERVDRFLTEGTAPRLELLRADAELSAAEADEAAARAGLERARSRLASLLERPAADLAGTPLRDVTTGSPGDIGGAAVEDPEARREAEALDRHPVLVAARHRLDAARAGLRLTGAAWFPSLRASGAFVEYGGGSASYTGEWQAGLQLAYPLFTGGARAAEADRARAGVRAAEAEVRRVRRALELAVDAERSAEREAVARAASLSVAVARFEELARVEALALEEGVGVQRDFLRAQAGLLQARAGLAEARRAVVLARTRIARALGLLTPEWIDRTLEPAS